MLEFVIYALEFAIEMMYEEMDLALRSAWGDAQAGFNSGQQSIYGNYIEPAVDEFLWEAWSSWPDTDALYYEAIVWGCYDLEVLERAFSDVIYMTTEPVDDWTMRAQETQEIMWTLEAISFF